jgi:hypothetical protein
MDGAAIEYNLSYGLDGKGGTGRNIDRVLRIRGQGGIERESGFTITETATRVVNVGAGFCWLGLRRFTSTDLPAIAQGGGGVASELWYHTGAGTWAKTTVTQYNNTQYDLTVAPYGLTGLLPSRYAVNWIFRNIVTDEIDIVLGTGDYTLSQATASMIPVLPEELTAFYVLCGRIIVKNGEATATQIENITDVSFRASTTSVHSELSNLAYGDSGHTGFMPANAWATYSPTLVWSTADPTGLTIVARWIQTGKLVNFYIDIHATDSNATDGVTISLPVAPVNLGALIPVNSVELYGVTGAAYTFVTSYIQADGSDNLIHFQKFQNTTDGQAMGIMVSGAYEVT